jgi:hypothetical protein
VGTARRPAADPRPAVHRPAQAPARSRLRKPAVENRRLVGGHHLDTAGHRNAHAPARRRVTMDRGRGRRAHGLRPAQPRRHGHDRTLHAPPQDPRPADAPRRRQGPAQTAAARAAAARGRLTGRLAATQDRPAVAIGGARNWRTAEGKCPRQQDRRADLQDDAPASPRLAGASHARATRTAAARPTRANSTRGQRLASAIGTRSGARQGPASYPGVVDWQGTRQGLCVKVARSASGWRRPESGAG